MRRSRSENRAHAKRVKNKVLGYDILKMWGRGPTAAEIGKVARTPAHCSCGACRMEDWNASSRKREVFRHSDRLEDWEDVRYRARSKRRRNGKRLCSKFDGPCEFTETYVGWSATYPLQDGTTMRYTAFYDRCHRCGRRGDMVSYEKVILGPRIP